MVDDDADGGSQPSHGGMGSGRAWMQNDSIQRCDTATQAWKVI